MTVAKLLRQIVKSRFCRALNHGHYYHEPIPLRPSGYFANCYDKGEIRE